MTRVWKLLWLLPALVSAGAEAGEIDRPFKCAVQSITFINLATNRTDAAEVKKEIPAAPIGVIYSRDDASGFIIEKYAFGSDLESTTLYAKGHSAGGTQYLSRDGKSAITYFGVQGQYHVIVKYSRMSRSDGGALTGFRHDSYANAFMYCAAIE